MIFFFLQKKIKVHDDIGGGNDHDDVVLKL